MIEQYIQSKQNLWSESTKKSETSRLKAIKECLTFPPNPDHIWNFICKKSPYTRVTTFIRVVDLYRWKQPRYADVLIKWREKNAQLFRNAYQKKTPEIDYYEAKKRIEGIKDIQVRNAAYHLLYSGLRVCELSTLTSSGDVIGKGGKKRKVIIDASTPICKVNYRKLKRALETIGLNPHDLRKIRATDYLRRCKDLPTVQHFFGWNDANTAMRYMAPLTTEKMRELLND